MLVERPNRVSGGEQVSNGHQNREHREPQARADQAGNKVLGTFFRHFVTEKRS
jgi:hypothetical protein